MTNGWSILKVVVRLARRNNWGLKNQGNKKNFLKLILGLRFRLLRCGLRNIEAVLSEINYFSDDEFAIPAIAVKVQAGVDPGAGLELLLDVGNLLERDTLINCFPRLPDFHDVKSIAA